MNLIQKLALAGSISLLSLVSSAQALPPLSPVMLGSKAIVWSPVKDMPKGAEVTLLAGDPTQQQLFVAWLKLPAGYKVPLHEHPINEYDTVISGTYYLGIGAEPVASKELALKRGSFIEIPAHTLHYGWAKEETILQISGVGPWGMIYPT